MSQERLFDDQQPRVGDVEEVLRNRGVRTVVGVDEAGRGPLAGPVVAAAVALELDQDPSERLEGLDDSKQLEVQDREQLFERLTGGGFVVGVDSSSPSVIDEINILQATFRAMGRAVDEVLDQLGERPDAILIDGQMTIPDGPPGQRAVVKGDGRSLAIAAASIVAKVTRDRRMVEFAERWPEYGFDGHKGYPTAGHREAIRQHGPCQLHRRSFSGVETGSNGD